MANINPLSVLSAAAVMQPLDVQGDHYRNAGCDWLIHWQAGTMSPPTVSRDGQPVPLVVLGELASPTAGAEQDTMYSVRRGHTCEYPVATGRPQCAPDSRARR